MHVLVNPMAEPPEQREVSVCLYYLACHRVPSPTNAAALRFVVISSTAHVFILPRVIIAFYMRV